MLFCNVSYHQNWRIQVPCSIGDKFKGTALCDLDASINLMPYSVFRELGIE